jgi:hypothetical protein
LDVQAVFGFVENGLGAGFEGFFVDFLAAIRREAMHDEGFGFGELKKWQIDLIASQDLHALGGFGLFAHGNPNIRVKQIGVLGGGFGIIENRDISAGFL